MSVESRAGMGVLLLAALLAVLLVDTFPRKYRGIMLSVVCLLSGAFMVWASL